ncbi:MAG: DNRLRE domain-containing protein [Anaerolineae bacterium]|nr:DNRLRE domain-containing protein [Anaerolineae bacterium]
MKKGHLLFSLLIVATGVVLAVAFAGSGASTSASTSLAGPAATPADPFGVYFYPELQPTGATQMVAAGARWAHTHIHWREVEYQRGTYDWSRLDAQLGNLAAHGFQLLVTVNENPDWAAATRCGPIDSEDLPFFANFLAAAVARYSVPPYNVLHWALYNEADSGDPVNFPWLGGCWGMQHPNHAPGAGGAAYAAMLQQVYPAMKAANPNVQVWIGGLAHDWFTDAGGIFDRDFLDQILAAGGGPYFDAINFHYFHAWESAWKTNDRYNRGIVRKAESLRERAANYGVNKPLVVTEVGHPTDAKDPTQDARLSEDLTARVVWQLYAQGMAAGISPLIWLEAVDEPDLDYAYGLLRSNLTPKLSYTAYQAMTRELAGAHFRQVRRDYPTNILGYEFIVGDAVKILVWVSGTSTVAYSFPVGVAGDPLRVVDKLGNVRLITDGGSGDLDLASDGNVRINLDANPRLISTATGAMPTNTPTPTPTRTPTPTPRVPVSPTPLTKSFQNGVAPNSSYSGADDAYVSEQQPTTNFGAVTPLWVTGDDPAGSHKDKWGLLRWNLSSLTGIVQAASLTLQVTDPSGGQSYELYEALGSWTGSKVNWNNKPARGNVVLGVAAPTVAGALTVELNADGLAVIQKWLNHPKQNYGFYLMDAGNTDALALESAEKTTASWRPRLTIVYRPPVFTRAPWVQNITATSAMILWETDAYARSTLKYRLQGTSTWTNKTVTTTLVGGAWQAQAALTGLQPAKTYEFQVRPSADGSWTGIMTFRTAATTAGTAAMEPLATADRPVTAAWSLSLAALPEVSAGENLLVPVMLTPLARDLDAAVGEWHVVLVYDPAYLWFNPADADDDGVPDALAFAELEDAEVQVVAEVGRLGITLKGILQPKAEEDIAPLLTVGFVATAPIGPGVNPVRLDEAVIVDP